MCCCSNFTRKRSCKETCRQTNDSLEYLNSIYPTRWWNLDILSLRLRGQSAFSWIFPVLLQLLHCVQEISKFSSSLCFSSSRSFWFSLITSRSFTNVCSNKTTWSSVIRSISIALCQRSSSKKQSTLRSNRKSKRCTKVADSWTKVSLLLMESCVVIQVASTVPILPRICYEVNFSKASRSEWKWNANVLLQAFLQILTTIPSTVTPHTILAW